jgi:hypothetical protein
VSHSELLLLGVAFFVVATVYTTVGHAGASGYLATMGLVGLADELVCQPVLPTTVVRDTAPSTP